MSQPIIEVRNLSKRYQLGAIGATSLREEASRIWDRARGIPHPDTKEFWALRDVSFDVQPGEVVGVIGRNGAGKSTLLKILSRITEPTGGKAVLRGRVASLLEVGTGFHPELTGRENVFLNGAILGMSRAEVRGKFDEIVAFAEVDQFIDTPVKRYSSGMYVRLAFAVAAHLEPEILIVDEVLAVGDQQFQAKCLGKMQDVARYQGRTVLFVSHNLAATQSLCNRVLALRAGSVFFDGPPAEAVARYLAETRPADVAAASTFHGRDPALCVTRAAYHPDPVLPVVEVDLTIRCTTHHRVGIEFLLSTTAGVPAAFAEIGSFDPSATLQLSPGDQTFSWHIDAARLANGAYFVAIQLVEPGITVKLRHEHPLVLDISRPPAPPARRVLEQAWQAGCVQVDVRRA